MVVADGLRVVVRAPSNRTRWVDEFAKKNGGGIEKSYGTMSVYGRYTRADELCQTNGHFSLNLRQGALGAIDRLLALDENSTVAWVGFGDGRELLSMAKRYPGARFVGWEVNGAAVAIARRVFAAEELTNVELRARAFETGEVFTHLYSTALSGPALYASMHACARRRCMLSTMWPSRPEGCASAVVRLAGSGMRRTLWCAG